MNEQSNPSILEKVSGSLATESMLTCLAAIVGGPLAPLLPVLTNSLAAERQKRRVREELNAINEALALQSELVRTLSDEQYKVVNEAVLAVFQTTQEEKLRLLRNAVVNALVVDVGQGREAVMLSRIIRDISAEEAAFLVQAFEFEGIQPLKTEPSKSFGDNLLRVDPNSKDYLSVSGLLSLGILAPGEAKWDGLGTMYFTSIAAKVIALLRAPGS